MEPPGTTRTRLAPRHALIAPDGHMDDAVPGWRGARTTILISPRLAAGPAPGFTQLLATLEPGGGADLPADAHERFVFAAEGELRVTTSAGERALAAEGYVLLPPGSAATLASPAGARLLVTERPYLPHGDAPPPDVRVGRVDDVPGVPFLGLDGVRAQALLPDHPAFDLAMTRMTYRPGAALPLVETHEAEHGLVLLSGSGILRLGDDWYPVRAGDAVWMGPYCPQWFAAIGDEDAVYLMYKDGRRGPWPRPAPDVRAGA